MTPKDQLADLAIELTDYEARSRTLELMDMIREEELIPARTSDLAWEKIRLLVPPSVSHKATVLRGSQRERPTHKCCGLWG